MINPEQSTALPSQMSSADAMSGQGFASVAGSEELLNSELMLMYDNAFMTPMPMEAFANLPPMPDQFCPEFYEYDRQSYHQSPRKRVKSEEPAPQPAEELSSAEMRRQIHIQSEQKRRAQIKDGFEELRKQLPNCSNKQVSKAAILSKTVVHLQHLKSTQHVLVAEIERLRLENDQLRGMQALMYPAKLYSIDHL